MLSNDIKKIRKTFRLGGFISFEIGFFRSRQFRLISIRAKIETDPKVIPTDIAARFAYIIDNLVSQRKIGSFEENILFLKFRGMHLIVVLVCQISRNREKI